MLVLAAANSVTVLLLGTLCLLRLSGRLGVAAFLGCLVLLFVLATVLWVGTERRHRRVEPLRRLGRIMVGLAIVVAGAPMAVLTPLFWLDAQLPPESQFQRTLGVVMASMLMALVLVVLVNAAGGMVIALRALAARGRPEPSGGSSS